MSLEKQWKMVQLLHERTVKGDVDWKQSPSENTFQVSFNRYTLILRQLDAENPEAFDYRVTLLNENGEVADTFLDTELYADLKDTLGGDVTTFPYPVLRRTYDLARRHALGSDRILDAIIL